MCFRHSCWICVEWGVRVLSDSREIKGEELSGNRALNAGEGAEEVIRLALNQKIRSNKVPAAHCSMEERKNLKNL